MGPRLPKRVWTVLDRLAGGFYDAVENAVVAELEAERNRPAFGAADAEDDRWGQDSRRSTSATWRR